MRSIVIALAFAACAAVAWAQDAVTQPDAPPTAPTPSTAPAHHMSQICARNTEHRRRYYPERAQSANIHGEVTLDCALNADNSLSTCQIVDETPPDYGFGDSALALACLWRLSEDTTGIYTSEASGERRIRKPVRFRLN